MVLTPKGIFQKTPGKTSVDVSVSTVVKLYNNNNNACYLHYLTQMIVKGIKWSFGESTFNIKLLFLC